MEFQFFNFLRVIKVKTHIAKICITGGFLCVLYLFINITAVLEPSHHSSRFHQSSRSAADSITNTTSFVMKNIKGYVIGISFYHNKVCIDFY